MSAATAWVMPSWTHRLVMALRFRDAFTDEVIGSALDVSVAIPAPPPVVFPPGSGSPSVLPPGRLGETRWRAARNRTDDTYRFFLTNQLFGHPPAQGVPPGLYDIAVVAPGAEYVNHESIQIQLPLPRTPPPPAALRSDFLMEYALWPTRRARLEPAETAVVGRVARVASGEGVAGVRVILFAVPGPNPGVPYARTDEAGDFVFRMPRLRRSAGGPVSVPCDFELRDAQNAPVAALQPAPGSIAVIASRVMFVEFIIP